MNTSEIKPLIEAILFASDQPVTLDLLRTIVPEIESARIQKAIEELQVEFSGHGIALCEVDCVHHHTRRAEAALQAVVLLERRLHRMQRPVCLRHPLDGENVGALGLHGEERAGLDRPPVHVHGTGAALRSVAADVRTGEPQRLADERDEKRALLHLRGRRLAVDLH